MQSPQRVALYAYCNSTRQWQAVQNTGATSPPLAQPDGGTSNKRFTCVTYNVFSGALSKSIPHASHRTRHAIELLSRSKADVIALQEASISFEQALRRERWLRQDWYLTSLQDYFECANLVLPESNNDKDGCIMAIKKSLVDEDVTASMLPLPGQQGKVLILVRARKELCFITSHFESLASSERTRLHQYNQLLEVVKQIPSCIVLADFNHSSYGELRSLVGTTKPPQNRSSQFTDCGLTIPGQSSSQSPEASQPQGDPLRDNPTFGVLYPFFEGSRRKEKRKPRRLDLILVKGDSLKLVKHWTDGYKPIQIDRRERPRENEGEKQKDGHKTQKVKLRCQQGKGGNTYASDHLAVLATFECS